MPAATTGEFETVGIVGAGFMGSGIAESAARAGLEVHLFEPWEESLSRSRKQILASVTKVVVSGKLKAVEGEALIDRITWTTDLADLGPAEIVIEAITEDAKVKGEMFTRLDQALPDAELIASNTSSIPIAQLAGQTSRPERVLGLHFFSPVPVMKLVEIVIGLDSSPAGVERAGAFVDQLGKSPIHTKDRAGFIVNRLLIPYLTAAVHMYEDGFASREDIDEGMRLGCGHPMGPLTLCDFIGLDVIDAVCESLYTEFKRVEYAPPPLIKRMIAAGRLGRKSGQGFYDYNESR